MSGKENQVVEDVVDGDIELCRLMEYLCVDIEGVTENLSVESIGEVLESLGELTSAFQAIHQRKQVLESIREMASLCVAGDYEAALSACFTVRKLITESCEPDNESEYWLG